MAWGERPADTGQAAARARYERDELLANSRALSSERDIRKLLDLIPDPTGPDGLTQNRTFGSEVHTRVL